VVKRDATSCGGPNVKATPAIDTSLWEEPHP